MPAEENRTAAETAAETREKRLLERQARISALEKEIADREKAAKAKEGAKKQVLLRLSASLWNELAAWAEADFRSINGQIEFLLSESVRNRKKHGSNEDK
jgi:hypothetical protein